MVQVELLPQPSKDRPEEQPWPQYPFLLKTSSSHEEGAERKWAVLTKEFIGEGTGRDLSVRKFKCIEVKFEDRRIIEV